MFEFVSDVLNLKQMGSVDQSGNPLPASESVVSPLPSLLPDVANETTPLTGG